MPITIERRATAIAEWKLTRADCGANVCENHGVRVAIITPFAGEPTILVERCRTSVRGQHYENLVHYLVSDGAGPMPLREEASHRLRQVQLPVRHFDYGNTARCVGSLCALNDGADLICYLDADNEYCTSHVSSVVERLQSGSYDVVFAKRRIFLPDYPDLPASDDADQIGHVDTNCIAFARSAAFMLPMWGLMPAALAPIGDMVMAALVRHFELRCVSTLDPTVVYWSTHAAHYISVGKVPPAGAKVVDTERVRSQFNPEEVWQRMRVELNLK
jgi:hypothetical protein